MNFAISFFPPFFGALCSLGCWGMIICYKVQWAPPEQRKTREFQQSRILTDAKSGNLIFPRSAALSFKGAFEILLVRRWRKGLNNRRNTFFRFPITDEQMDILRRDESLSSDFKAIKGSNVSQHFINIAVFHSHLIWKINFRKSHPIEGRWPEY